MGEVSEASDYLLCCMLRGPVSKIMSLGAGGIAFRRNGSDTIQDVNLKWLFL